jgi:hypothetical protein
MPTVNMPKLQPAPSQSEAHRGDGVPAPDFMHSCFTPYEPEPG